MEKQAGSAKVDVKNVLIEMRRYRMGLIQTPEQLRFSFLAIIDGMKCLRPLSNGTAATDEEKPAAGEEEADVRQRKPAAAEQSQVSDASPANNNSAHERERQREERKRKTEETIKRIKDKSKELEQKSRFKSKILKLGLIGAVLLLGAGVLYGFFLSGRGPSPAIPHRPLQNLSH